MRGRSPFEVRRLTPADLFAFQGGMPSWNATEYARRLGAQERGLLVQMVAWAMDAPVGRGMVVLPGHPEWSASAHRELSPEVRDVETVAGWRRRGVARALMAALEGAVRERGFERIGLAVSLDAPALPARELYRALGYRHAHGPYVASTRLEADGGSSFAVGAVLTYLVKDL